MAVSLSLPLSSLSQMIHPEVRPHRASIEEIPRFAGLKVLGTRERERECIYHRVTTVECPANSKSERRLFSFMASFYYQAR
eukprot:CAMPEP_0114540924 /NCGR_PEP_ID=MMETSP0114-20121206/1030_1 /TAXON_ID=31324 /ORGANISM="Goniomonas sp, Strain m" /LENGTH=80 /DNA_ID=CAMNT_0001725125 /DNA_START=413 /DNA_END=655 /DNA_ORIENTATION=-